MTVILAVIVVLIIDSRIHTEEVTFVYEGIPRMDISLADTTLEEIDNNEKSVKYDGNTVELMSWSVFSSLAMFRLVGMVILLGSKLKSRMI